MSNKMNVFDNVSLFAIPEASNHLVTKAYADSSQGASGTMLKITNPVLPLTRAGQVFYLSVVSNSAVSVDVSDYTFSTNEILEFTLIIFTTGASISFSGWSWHNGTMPNLGSAGWYVIHCTSVNSGANWLAKLEGSYSFPAKYKWVTTLSDATSHTGTSLRDAIGAASAGDVVMFAPGLEGTITLEQGELEITNSLTINGGQKITVDADEDSRAIHVSSATANLTLNGLDVTNGAVTDENGAGILALGNLVMTDCTVSDCVLTAEGNSSTTTFFGGGIAVAKNFTATRCTLTGNSIVGDGTLYGGGVSVNGKSGTTSVFTLSDCTLSDNTVS